MEGAVREEAWLLQLRVQVGCGGCMVSKISQQVVSSGAIPSPTAAQCVVSVAVEDAVAARALYISQGERHAEPALEHANIQAGLVGQVGVSTRCSVQPQTGTRS